MKEKEGAREGGRMGMKGVHTAFYHVACFLVLPFVWWFCTCVNVPMQLRIWASSLGKAVHAVHTQHRDMLSNTANWVQG